ncbi:MULTISPECIES: DNA cytosine methyltransferase [Rhizobium]|uniref:DNA cytosine methyltransferase n=1 Tax=Rhizobium TaxID=379 RepID=UPI00387841C4
MHRAGFKTIAACEFVDWRRALYQQNNPGVRIYDDVRTLTADQLVRDLGRLPSVVVGSPPCQDISSANTKGKGVEGARSGLYFEAVRIIGEVRPRWFALENSSNLRTRGADAVLAALEALGYACWPFVVRAGDIGANHERPRCWIIGCDVEQVADANGLRWHEGWGWGRSGINISVQDDLGYANQTIGTSVGSVHGWQSSDHCGSDACNPTEDGCGQGRPGRLLIAAERVCFEACRDGADASEERQQGFARGNEQRPAEVSEHPDLSARPEVGGSEANSRDASEPWSGWNGGLAGHLQLDDGISPWLAGTRIAVGGPRGTSAASLIVEAFGDAVVPQIPEAIGRAILRTEAALAAVYGKSAA